MGRLELGAPAFLVGADGPVPAVTLHAALQSGVHDGQASLPFRCRMRFSGTPVLNTSR